MIGDSTGHGPERWVGQFATLLAQERDRQVVLHDWDDDQAGYAAPRAVGIGGRPITVWNASAPGQGPGYSKDNLQEMIPDGVSPDVVIVNHGHNTGPDIAADTAELMSALQFQYPDTPLAYTVQNPFRGVSPAEYEARAADELASGEQHGWRIVDVYDAFTSAPDLAALYVDDRHENAQGGILWARTVLEATGL